MNRKKYSSAGFALFTVMMMLAVMASMLAAYSVITRTELGLVKSSRDSNSGFNAAEAGLNLRAEEIRAIFEDYDRPLGTSPSSVSDCDAGSIGSGDYICKTHSFSNGHTAVTYVADVTVSDPPPDIVIPPGEAYQGLSAYEYRYTVTSIGRNSNQSNEAILDLTFKSRWIPLFQFAAFFVEDLEITNGAVMTIAGPVHTNTDIYVAPTDGDRTDFTGQLTVSGTFYRGQKSSSTCSGRGGSVRVLDPTNYVTTPACSSSRVAVTDVAAWNDNILLGVEPLEVPEPEDMDPFGEGEYWIRADLRLVLRLNSSDLPDTTNSSTGIEVVDVDGVNIAAATDALHDSANCPGLVVTGTSGPALAVGTQGPGTTGNQLRQYREYNYSNSINDFQRTLEVDVQALLNCIQLYPQVMGSKTLDDDTEDGLVFYMTIDGNDRTAAHNNYGIRLRNAAELQSNVSGAPSVRGMSIVTDQGLNIWGNYNTVGWIPAALMADSMFLLSTNWVDANSYQTTTYNRQGLDTTVYAALVTGIARTGGANGPAGQDLGDSTKGGGLINLFRFNEHFHYSSGGQPDFTYVGSMVSLGPTRHSASSWYPFNYYSAPNRVWSYDTRFNDPDNLPPMTPAAVSLRQELFVRNYEL